MSKATVETMQVSVKVVRIGKKQMTLAVFRQLKTINILDEEGELLPYDYWGIVNYNVKDEGQKWVVLQSEGSLYRACVDLVENWSIGHNYKEACELVELDQQYRTAMYRYEAEKEETARRYEETLEMLRWKNIERPIEPDYNYGSLEWKAYKAEKAVWDSYFEGSEALMRRGPKQPSAPHKIQRDDLYTFCQKAMLAKMEELKRNESLKSLHKMTQLFIAV